MWVQRLNLSFFVRQENPHFFCQIVSFTLSENYYAMKRELSCYSENTLSTILHIQRKHTVLLSVNVNNCF